MIDSAGVIEGNPQVSAACIREQGSCETLANAPTMLLTAAFACAMRQSDCDEGSCAGLASAAVASAIDGVARASAALTRGGAAFASGSEGITGSPFQEQKRPPGGQSFSILSLQLLFLPYISSIPSPELNTANFVGAGSLWNELQHFSKGLTKTRDRAPWHLSAHWLTRGAWRRTGSAGTWWRCW